MKLRAIQTLLGAIVASQLAACGGGDGSGETSTPEPTTPPAPTIAVTFPSQQAAPVVTTLDETGDVLLTEAGLSLYFFTPDPQNTSICNGVEGDAPDSTTDAESCAGAWPPLLALESAQASGDLGFITRDSGARQWAYKGFPLYTYIGDSAQGDISGEGLNDVWFLARPDAVSVNTQAGADVYVANGTVKTASSNNEILTELREDKDGLSLYTFDVDGVGSSACYGLNGDECITAWPPLLADKEAKASYPLSVITLDNGLLQWAYQDKPLYFFVGDSAPGDVNGDGLGGVWHVANNQPAIVRTVDDIARLSATGNVLVLLPESETSDTLSAQRVDRDQFTLYTFDADEPGVSNCSDDCAAAWPAFIADENDNASGDFSIFTRTDGLSQWAYNDMPLYFFVGDTEKGQINGDGLGGVWHKIPNDAVPAEVAPVTANSSDLGSSLVANGEVTYLTRNNGENVVTTSDRTDFQLYIFDNDTLGVSNCDSDDCINAWPPLLAGENAQPEGPYSVIERKDGLMQWAVNGQALYFFAGDTAAGQQTGESLGDVWWVARAAPLRVFNHDDKGAFFVANGTLLPSIGKTAEQLQDLTLYTFDSDTAGSGVSTCFDSCAQTWPPLYASADDTAFGDFTIISRTESDNTETRQWAYKGLPLYFFVSDANLGDTLGDYPGWPLARP